MILALAGGGHAAEILLYAGYFRGIPKELEEAAVAGRRRLPDGVLPRHAAAGRADHGHGRSLLTFLATWNSFLSRWSSRSARPELRTVSVGMLAFSGSNETDWAGLAAAATISLVPIVVLFFFVQRYFVEGVAGAVKA